jgi:hypothetical protein
MDLRAYYKKVREIENTLSRPFAVVVSVETPDGGKAGVLTEVATLTAAKHMAEGRARAATTEESNGFHARNQEAKQAADNAASVNRMQFVVVPANSGPVVSKE